MSVATHPALLPQRRWVASRKETVARAIHLGEVTTTEVLSAHANLSPDELGGWLHRLRKDGRAGLAALQPRARQPGR